MQRLSRFRTRVSCLAFSKHDLYFRVWHQGLSKHEGLRQDTFVLHLDVVIENQMSHHRLHLGRSEESAGADHRLNKWLDRTTHNRGLYSPRMSPMTEWMVLDTGAYQVVSRGVPLFLSHIREAPGIEHVRVIVIVVFMMHRKHSGGDKSTFGYVCAV